MDGHQIIEAKLLQRYPFLLVDRVVELEPGKKATALKSVTRSDPHMQGHFPGEPIMPGVLMLEAVAQTAALMLADEYDLRRLFWAGVERAKFHHYARPGEVLTISVEKKTAIASMVQVSGRVTSEDRLVLEATITLVELQEAPTGV